MEIAKYIVLGFCLIAGSALIIAQIVTSRKANKQAETIAANAAANPTAGLPPEIGDLLGKVASAAPLMIGGIVLYILAAVLSGGLVLAASTTAGVPA